MVWDFKKATHGKRGGGDMQSLREELIATVRSQLTPVAKRYLYAEEGLEESIKWYPMVLLLGNYSSGKSTLVNELLGMDVQDVGQAPTDDSFTVLTYQDQGSEIVTREGSAVVSDPQLPFQGLRQHGSRFTSHFKLKMVPSPLLKNLAIIDTPGMLDSVTEKGRGYNYQHVIGDLAQMADVIIVMFDPHKAGTVRETYESLRTTLPKSTYEDRVVFVLNRIDECANLNDMLKVYGTLCWNLSQMTGRKDIPPVLFTYLKPQGELPSFLSQLENQRPQLEDLIASAPKHRLDHLATYLEEHAQNLSHYLEALLTYGRGKRVLISKLWLWGAGISLVAGVSSYALIEPLGVSDEVSFGLLPALGGVIFLACMFLWSFVVSYRLRKYHTKTLVDIDSLTHLEWQSRRESWQKIKPMILKFLARNNGRFSMRKAKMDKRKMDHILKSRKTSST
jgi:GTPase SAR1 family protein